MCTRSWCQNVVSNSLWFHKYCVTKVIFFYSENKRNCLFPIENHLICLPLTLSPRRMFPTIDVTNKTTTIANPTIHPFPWFVMDFGGSEVVDICCFTSKFALVSVSFETAKQVELRRLQLNDRKGYHQEKMGLNWGFFLCDLPILCSTKWRLMIVWPLFWGKGNENGKMYAWILREKVEQEERGFVFPQSWHFLDNEKALMWPLDSRPWRKRHFPISYLNYHNQSHKPLERHL